MFKLVQKFKPTGDQPQAIERLVKGIQRGDRFLTLLGITGSGKTFTISNVIHRLNRPALILSPNKILAAQLFQEFRSFFPYNAVHFFVSYYDYYQPEAYIPETDTYIAKDARINELLDQLRHAALQSALTRRDFIIVSSVSCLYGIGDPEEYQKVGLNLKKGEVISKKALKDYLKKLQYEKSGREIRSGTYRFYPLTDEGIEVEIILPDGLEKVSIFLKKNRIQSIKKYPIIRTFKNKLNLAVKLDNFEELEEFTIYPAKFFVTPQEKLEIAIANIKQELQERYWELIKQGKIIEAHRLRSRTLWDIHLLEKHGYCPGIENYSRHLSFRKPGEPPYTLLDYIPKDTVIFIDESHLSIPQIKAMARGDRQRKEVLIEYGWRLPSAIDNRPLTFEEFFSKGFQTVFVSATPGAFERKVSSEIVEQLIRPTYIPDPKIEIRETKNQVVDILNEIKERIKKKERTLVLTLTKRSAENLTEFLLSQGIKAHYLHSDIKTLKRAEIIKSLRKGEIDVLIGVNLLREGLDLPEVSLVAILDADREGFLRNETTLIQAIGRAARHLEGKAILYADKITNSIRKAVNETNRRRKIQIEYIKKSGVVPKPIVKEIYETPLEILERAIKLETLSKEELIEFLEEELSNL